MRVGLINIGLGNIASILNMLKQIGVSAHLINGPADCFNSDIIILPGVGHFDEGIRAIHRADLFEPLLELINEGRVRILGICLGMQLLCRGSEEGNAQGLGIIDAEVKKFSFSSESRLKVPHMGWNAVLATRANILLSSTREQRFYFVHSYKVIPSDPGIVIGLANHGGEFCAAFQQGVVFGVQFHPEKSHRFGMDLMRSFIEPQKVLV